MFILEYEPIGTIQRPLSPGQVRQVIRAFEQTGSENKTPAAIFLCSLETPNVKARTFRKSFQTICSVDDLSWYPEAIADDSLRPDPAETEEGTLIYSLQENHVWIRDESESWVLYTKRYAAEHGQLFPRRHPHHLPFFRTNTIDVIWPNSYFVTKAKDWLDEAVLILNKDITVLRKS
jgi:hypothetical protein